MLQSAYRSAVKSGDKAIAIAPSEYRRNADVIVAVEYRRYIHFRSQADQQFTEGVCFYNASGDLIANYPKQHSANLTTKHQTTNSWLKPMVRILKNLRGRLIDKGMLKPGLAPSYYLEGLLYTVPTESFLTDYQTCFVNAINWIQNEADKDKLVCANEQYYLLFDNVHVSWPKANAEAFMTAPTKLWNEWGK